MKNKEITAIGLMCGTSRDGLDIAYCRLRPAEGYYHYEIDHAQTVDLPESLQENLSGAETSDGEFLIGLDNEIGEYFASQVNSFLAYYNAHPPDLIASHGITLFHRPEQGLTFQLGNGATMASKTNIKVVCNFRQQDVALGGQGAPLTPYADKLLFPTYDATINLGGFANISVLGNTVAGYDLTVCNLALNHIAAQLGAPFDRDGNIARKGRLDDRLLQKLESPDFFRKSPPKSLGKEWFVAQFMPLYRAADPHDALATICEHIAIQVRNATRGMKNVLITGGGARNIYLVERIKALSEANFEVPDTLLIDYKEALCFALLGVLRVQEKINVSASVTGASRDTVSGAVYLP